MMHSIFSVCSKMATISLVLGLFACQSNTSVQSNAVIESRWFNPSLYDGVNIDNNSIYTIGFDYVLIGADETEIRVKNCYEVITLSSNEIAPREFTRWQLMKDNCENLDRYYRSAKKAISYWQGQFDYLFIKSLPATAVPDLGGQGLEGRSGSLGEQESTLTLVESGIHNVKVRVDDMTINYVLVAQGDFNSDGYQDKLIRLIWDIENTFGDGYDWIVVSKTSLDAAPMMLWRK